MIYENRFFPNNYLISFIVAPYIKNETQDFKTTTCEVRPMIQQQVNVAQICIYLLNI
jgi:hypothetical protein